MIENKMFLSIIIPVYNAERYLAECLGSCLQQDLPYEEYEIICVNDGSTDNSVQILEYYQTRYKNIIVINQANQGVSVARNSGIDIAKSEYIWFVDADDLIQENVLYKLKNIAEDAQKDCFFLKAYYFKGELSEEEIKLKNQGLLFPAPELRTEYCTLKLFRRQIIVQNNIKFAKGIAFGEDQLFNFEFFKYAENNEVLEISTYFHRIHQDSVMQSGGWVLTSKRRAAAVVQIILFLIQEQSEEQEPNKTKTIKYLFSRREVLLEIVSRLPLKDMISELKRVRAAGIFNINYLAPKSIKIKRKQRYSRTYFLRMRIKYIWKEKILSRVSHPLRTLKNLTRKVFNK